VVGKPVILIPSPNVSEDHQTKNAMALVEKNAAIMIPDKDSVGHLMVNAMELMTASPEKKNDLGKNIKKLGIHNAAELIVKEVISLVKR
jgi:UDP-N-acetylglucosamine--N-acetylmuramyl-(pentapeptide) pyrophosphoryl-undecaprenol N-acetylglucosamine transferase